jgi:hypothetical protein
MAVIEHDKSGAPFSVGTYVYVRCLVTAIETVSENGTGGAADFVTCLVDTPGNVGEQANVFFVVSPVQCKKSS